MIHTNATIGRTYRVSVVQVGLGWHWELVTAPTVDLALAKAVQLVDPHHWAWAESLPVSLQTAPASALDSDPSEG